MSTESKLMKNITLYTIGYTKKSAEAFFGALQEHDIRTLIDVRLNTQSQLAAFAKASDLIYFLRALVSCDYVHMVEFAPTKELLKEYQAKHIDWQGYEAHYKAHIKDVPLALLLERVTQDRSCLLCSEFSAEQCHRRLLAEYVASRYENISIQHI